MPVLIKNFSDNSILEYDQGKFDEYCIYLTRPDIERRAPTDSQYFTALSRYGNTFGHERIYNDFVLIYDKTEDFVDLTTLELCSYNLLCRSLVMPT